ncbi:GtrA family protein [Anaerotruncus rubiinfantis]|uniref:GtrA family protein n=1 Tax=Anaerotruncus rubiinfantis TaxID=1720200 RepID=UPI0034A18D49
MSKLEGRGAEELKRIVKFGITGVVNTLVDMAVGALLLFLGVNVYASKCVGYCAGMLNSYLINRKWTFQTKDRFFSLQMVRFIATNLIVLAVSVVLIKVFVEFLGLSDLFAMLLSTCCTMALNFIISRLWVFK